jgi:hypothetical protein
MKLFNSSFLISIVVFVSSCKEEAVIPPVGEFSSVSEYLNDRKSAPQTFTIMGNTDATITGAKGTVLEFPAFSFVDASGIYVSGEIEIELLEIQSNSDMIFNNVFPESDAGWLNSGGMYHVSAKQGEQTLSIAPGAHYSAKVPAQVFEGGMALYEGEESGDRVNWTLLAQVFDSADVFNFVDYEELDNTYNYLTDSIGWCNCDYFSGDPVVSCTFNINGEGTYNFTNTAGFAVLDVENAVFPLNYPESSIIEQSGLGIVAMHILIISVLDDILYYGLLPITPEAGAVYDIDMIETTGAELDAIILSL